MRRYAVVGEAQTPAAASGGGTEADAGIIAVVGSTSVRPHVYYIAIGVETTSADRMLGWGAGLFTAPGTWGTTPTPTSMTDDGVAGGSVTGGRVDASAAPTYAGQVLKFGLHQRATFEWFEDPERGVIVPPVANNGLAVYCDYSSAGVALNTAATIHFAE